MKRLTLLAIALLIACTPAAKADPADGNDLRVWCYRSEPLGRNWSTCIGYVTAVIDLSPRPCDGPLPSVNIQQASSVVGRWIERNPQRWHEPAPTLVMDALRDAFCKR